MNPLLSICIPTYNRASELDELLRSIHESLKGVRHKDLFEVCISDNYSCDNTWETVEQWQGVLPNCRIYQQECNRGPDANYLQLIDMASGEYFWLVGSDDQLIKDALPQILLLLEGNEAQIVLLDFFRCDINLSPIRLHRWCRSKADVFDTSNQLAEFYDQAQPCWGLFWGYITSLIVKRSAWLEQGYDERYSLSLYSFMYPVFLMVARGCVIRNIKKPLVLNRGNNDSMPALHANKVFHRLSMDVDWYLHFGDLISDPAARTSWLNLGKRNFGVFYMLKFSGLSSKKEWGELSAKLLRLGFDSRYLAAVRLMKGLARACLYLIDARQRLKKRFRQYSRSWR